MEQNKNYRNPKFIERYEDVVFELETALNTVIANGAHQIKENHRFVVDNTGESTPFDWYNARFNVTFILKKLANGANIAVGDNNGIVTSSSALIKKMNVLMNGVDVYNCTEANHATNIKNLLEYSQGYSKSQGTNEFFYIDTSRDASEDDNSGFKARKVLLSGNRGVNVEIPLNRYSFFGSLLGELLPTSRIEIKIQLESDENLVWQAADDCRVVVTQLQLLVPRIVFNADGKSLYMSEYIKTRQWKYLRERVEISNTTR